MSVQEPMSVWNGAEYGRRDAEPTTTGQVEEVCERARCMRTLMLCPTWCRSTVRTSPAYLDLCGRGAIVSGICVVAHIRGLY
jgi:hypothetical protein